MEDLGSGGVSVMMLVVWAAIYVYFSFCFMTIANKTGTEGAWMAWVPIIQVILLCRIAGKPAWWLVLFFVPLLNLIFAIIVFMGVAQARGKASWLGVLMIVPLVNLVIPGYLAFAD